MKEFGSDFHFIPNGSHSENTLNALFSSANYYADGRQALIHLYRSKGWQRLWVPEYFCYDVIASLREAGLELVFYTDCPSYHDDGKTLEAIQQKNHFRPTDAILRVNYFGMRSFRSPEKLSVAAVVEDHTHDLIGDWAFRSEADWCIASLRKTLPIPEGGMLWSPVGLRLPEKPESSEENEKIAAIRWEAMRIKARYLAGEDIEKSAFRAGYLDTEEYFDHTPVSALDKESMEYLKTFDIRSWYMRKYENWEALRGIKKDGVKVIVPEGRGGYPFSLVLLFDEPSERDRVRKEVIEHQIYPAILWNVPSPTDGEAFKFSRGMLSIHCDGRYNAEDIQQMKSIIESIL
ncbi:MAG: hypothetical protein IJ209_10460 [Bacteroidaceae bacterium]|nr:hypothetical protein [Bacteroidaceae bacterium]